MNIRIKNIKGFSLQINDEGGHSIMCLENGHGRVFTIEEGEPYMVDVDEDEREVLIHYKVDGEYGYYLHLYFGSSTIVLNQHYHNNKSVEKVEKWDFARYAEEGCYMKDNKEVV